MAVEDRNVAADAKFPLKEFVIPLIDPQASQTDTEFWNFLPGYEFEVVDVQTFCETETNVTGVDVKVGGTSCLTGDVAVTADTRVAGTLHGTLANRRGTNLQALTLEYDSGGSAACRNGTVTVTIAKIPRQGEVLYTG